jgi:hypothetical protein
LAWGRMGMLLASNHRARASLSSPETAIRTAQAAVLRLTRSDAWPTVGSWFASSVSSGELPGAERGQSRPFARHLCRRRNGMRGADTTKPGTEA